MRAVGVLQLFAVDGYLRPCWRITVGGPFGTPNMETFEALASELAGGPVANPQVLHHPSLGWSLAVKLHLRPQISPGADSLIFFAGDGVKPDSLQQVVADLLPGLDAHRRHQVAEAALAAIEASPDAIELSDRAARLLYVNRAWQDYFGYEASEAIGKTAGALLRDQIDPLHDSAFYQFALDSLAEGEPFNAALACRSKDGDQLFCEVSVGAFSNKEARLAGNFAIRRDLHNRTERERALAVAHREFRSVLSALPDGVVVITAGRIAFANPAFLALVRADEDPSEASTVTTPSPARS